MEKRLLIVDDEDGIVEIISEALSNLFDVIDCASSVELAQQLVNENAYSLIFLDINLGNKNGAEIIKYILAQPSNHNNQTPLVIISGIITPQFVDRYHKRFAGILMKPFDFKDVKKVAEEILGITSEEVPKDSTPASVD